MMQHNKPKSPMLPDFMKKQRNGQTFSVVFNNPLYQACLNSVKIGSFVTISTANNEFIAPTTQNPFL